METTANRPAHETVITVRGYHLDLYGHVNNARYLEFLEEGRWAWMEQRTDLATILGAGPSMVMVRLEIDYRYPAGLGEQLVVATELGQVGARSAVYRAAFRPVRHTWVRAGFSSRRNASTSSSAR